MKNLIALTLALALSGCANNGALNAAATADVNTALETACPILTVVQSDVASGMLTLNKYQTAAVNSLALACPPNPAPTNATTAASDILAAFALLQPLVAKKS